jgi:hypothetical protein
MSNMQGFYARLFPEGDVSDPQMKELFQLTEASLTQMKALESDMGWDSWQGKAA